VNKPEVTLDMIDNLAYCMVEQMTWRELIDHVYEDLRSIMREDEELFWINFEEQGFDHPDDLIV
jgi:hypothetical protein